MLSTDLREVHCRLFRVSPSAIGSKPIRRSSRQLLFINGINSISSSSVQLVESLSSPVPNDILIVTFEKFSNVFSSMTSVAIG